MKPIAARIAEQRHLPSSDYRDVMRELKKQQLEGAAILPFYQERLKQIEKIIVDQQIVTLPDRPAQIRIATAAETAQQPAPHMVPPPFLHNSGQQGEFVLPLNIPAAPGVEPRPRSMTTSPSTPRPGTLIAHEARPGHELQFDSMLEHGVSLARVRYAFNSTNVEGWGLYSDNTHEAHMPLEGAVWFRSTTGCCGQRGRFSIRSCRRGRFQPSDAYRVLEQDVVQSACLRREEVERYTYRAPGQANSYFYGYTKLLALRKETETRLGDKFNQKKVS